MLCGGSNTVDTRHQECTVLCNYLATFRQADIEDEKITKLVANNIRVDNGMFINGEKKRTLSENMSNLFLIILNTLYLWCLSLLWALIFVQKQHLAISRFI